MKHRTLFCTLTLVLTLIVSILSNAKRQLEHTPEKNNHLRIATFNIGLDAAKKQGDLYRLMADGEYTPAQKSAEIIQRVRPDIVLLNEIDGHDDGKTLRLYQTAYLQQGQNHQTGITYPYVWQAECNTGLRAEINFRDPNGSPDKFGFGHYEGQYCMAILSKYPIDRLAIKTFQRFLWRDFPTPLLPQENGKLWYSKEGMDHFRLSSKTHADVPVNVNGQRLHLLVSHPTPPVFDGPEDRNGRRNHDEIKFWEYYINGTNRWLYADNQDKSQHKFESGLTTKQRFVIMGDLNSSVIEGDATELNGKRAITSLLSAKQVMSGLKENGAMPDIPESLGGSENDPDNPYSRYHTAVWKMRADYVIPSDYGFTLIAQGVFWPSKDDPLHYLVQNEDSTQSSSDHRLVWVDLRLSD